MDGVIVINKPQGWTSHDVVAKLRGVMGIKKIGHTGTLDPMATGVLPICVGKATRMIEYYDNDIKSYRAKMQLGIATDTLDMSGEILESKDFSYVTEQAIIDAFNEYKGWIEQTPPKYSAIRINGRRAYDMAREGLEVNINPRKIFIKDIIINSIDIISGIVSFDVLCSKGTYIRTICDDIGNKLGCKATMTELIRTSSGVFTLDEAIELDEVLNMNSEEACNLLRQIDTTLVNLGIVELKPARVKYFLNGNETGRIGYSIIKEASIYRVYYDSMFLGTGSIDKEGELKALKVVVDR